VSGAPLTTRVAQNGPQAYYTVHTDCGASVESLSDAIARSDNCAFVRTELSLGPGHFGADGAHAVMQTASAMGIDTSNFLPVVTTTLGTNGVHPLEMADAYSVFPNEGVLHRATFITRIVDRNNKVIYQAPSVGTRVLDPNVARMETQMLFGPPRHGTAAGTLGNFPRPIAGKTGTTDHSQDAWWIGYTPQVTAAVWMGDLNQEVPMNINGRQVFGADYPAKIWRAFMLAETANLPPLGFTPPSPGSIPSASFITEFGRKVGRGVFPLFPPTSTPVIPTPSPTTTPGNSVPAHGHGHKQDTTTTAPPVTDTVPPTSSPPPTDTPPHP
jgi:penicillin-binding protein 1A